MREKINIFAIVITFGCLMYLSAGDFASANDSAEQVLQFLERLQDSQPSGLVPIFAGSDYTTTYSNAMAAIAFTTEGELERASDIFDAFLPSDPCPTCACTGGYQQYRNAVTGNPDPVADPNDFWIGDNAWLLVALKYYRQVTNDHQYDDELIQQLVNWFVCLEAQTPDPGIYSGFRKNGDLMEFRHPEGSIDVYGALKDLGVDDVRTSIKNWLDQEVWIPEGDCFRIGPANQWNLPTDNVSWGYLALGPEYECILPYAEALTARTQNRYLIEIFDREDYWVSATSTPSIEVSLDREQHGQGHDLVVTYTCPTKNEWFLFYRDRDIHLKVTNGFRYFFWMKGDGSGNRFEVKLQNKTEAQETFWHHFQMDFTDWRRIEVRYDQFDDFDGPQAPLSEIGKIEFAVNTDTSAVTNSEFRIGRIWYHDSGAAYLFPVDGFDAFESKRNWLFVEGTGQMATAYCVGEQTEKWEHYVSELTNLLQPTMNGEALGLPNFLTGGINQPVPESVASSWYIIAIRCLNPFNPLKNPSIYLPIILKNGL